MLVVVILVVRALLPEDRHVPIDALPLAPGGEVIATYEDPPVDSATNDTFVRWLVIAGRVREKERPFDERQRFELVRKGWRTVTPRAPRSYAALSPDGRYRLAVLTTATVAQERSERLLVPSEIGRRLRGTRTRSIQGGGRPILVAQIDRYVDSEPGAEQADNGLSTSMHRP